MVVSFPRYKDKYFQNDMAKRGRDRWADVDISHLDGDPEKKKQAMTFKNKIIGFQRGRSFRPNDFDYDREIHDSEYVTTKYWADHKC